MSEQCDRTAQEIAKNPGVNQLLTDLEKRLGTKFFIVGAGTAEQEAGHKVFLAKQEAERREAEARFAQDNPVSPEIIQALLTCLKGK